MTPPVSETQFIDRCLVFKLRADGLKYSIVTDVIAVKSPPHPEACMMGLPSPTTRMTRVCGMSNLCEYHGVCYVREPFFFSSGFDAQAVAQQVGT